jgi:hypothetical protein
LDSLIFFFLFSEPVYTVDRIGLSFKSSCRVQQCLLLLLLCRAVVDRYGFGRIDGWPEDAEQHNRLAAAMQIDFGYLAEILDFDETVITRLNEIRP